MDAMFDDYESHLVPDESHNTISNRDWSYVDGYIRWFFRVSHLYMVQAALGDQSISAHQEIPEEDHAQLDHVEDALSKCHRIVEIT